MAQVIVLFLSFLLSSNIAFSSKGISTFYGVTVGTKKYAWYEESISYQNEHLLYKNKTFKKEGVQILEEIYDLKVNKSTFEPIFFSFIRQQVGRKLEFSGKASNDQFLIKSIVSQQSKANKDKYSVPLKFVFSSLLTFKLKQDEKLSPNKKLFEYQSLIEDSYQSGFKLVRSVFLKKKLTHEKLVGGDGKTHQVPCQEYQYTQYKANGNDILLNGAICIGSKGELVSFKDLASQLLVLPIPEKYAKVFFK